VPSSIFQTQSSNSCITLSYQNPQTVPREYAQAKRPDVSDRTVTEVALTIGEQIGG